VRARAAVLEQALGDDLLSESMAALRKGVQRATLCEGGFVECGDNLLAFGLPGRGKPHLVCAIGHEPMQRGHGLAVV
jgi:DNA replication protein DnaC